MLSHSGHYQWMTLLFFIAFFVGCAPIEPFEHKSEEIHDAGRKESPRESDVHEKKRGDVDDVPEVECVDSQTMECFAVPLHQQGVGICTPGKKVCVDGKWSQCVGPTPTAELCNGKDDDCDGSVDEDFFTSGKACTVPNAKGECMTGTWLCDINGAKCAPLVLPQAEVCDGKDNDCDGDIDEDFFTSGKACTVPNAKGECMTGTWLCDINGAKCAPLVFPQAEVCDGKDNDCDGDIDEDIKIPGTCSLASEKGECRKGMWMCIASTSKCVPPPPKAEVCDGKDNDCDGEIDEDFFTSGKACTATNAKGVCRLGRWVCDINGAKCEPSSGTAEVCNGKDDNCNGKIDEYWDGNTLSLTCYTGPAQLRGIGNCQDGVQECTAGKWGACKNSTLPTTEVCDGRDNDCDGFIDESLTKSCTTTCNKAGLETCKAGKWSACSLQVKDDCNQKDDDCDGEIDEDCLRIPQKLSWIGPQRKGHWTSLLSVRYNPSGTQFVTLSKGGIVNVWDASQYKHLSTSHRCQKAQAVAFGQKGYSVDCAESKEYTFRYVSSKLFRNHVYASQKLDYTGTHLPISPPPTESVTLTDLDSNIKSPIYKHRVLLSTYPTACISIRHDKRMYLYPTSFTQAGGHSRWELVNLATNQITYPSLPDYTLLKATRLARDNKTILTWNANIDLYDYEGTKQRSIVGTCTFASVIMTPDLKHLVSRDCNSIAIWNVATGASVRKITNGQLLPQTFDVSPNGKHILVGYDDGSIVVWEFSTGQKLHTIGAFHTTNAIKPHTSPVKVLEFDNNSQYLASGATNTRIWRVSDGKLLWTFTEVGAVAFHPSQPIVAIGSVQTIVQYNLTTGKLIRSFKTNQLLGKMGIETLRYSSDGKHLHMIYQAQALDRGRNFVGLDATTGTSLFPKTIARLFTPDAAQLIVPKSTEYHVIDRATNSLIAREKTASTIFYLRTEFISKDGSSIFFRDLSVGFDQLLTCRWRPFDTRNPVPSCFWDYAQIWTGFFLDGVNIHAVSWNGEHSIFSDYQWEGGVSPGPFIFSDKSDQKNHTFRYSTPRKITAFSFDKRTHRVAFGDEMGFVYLWKAP